MEPYIPQLTTPQTEIIRSNYPNIEHLEAGNIAIWLQERRDQLWQQAKDIETSSDTAKVINLGVAAVSSIMVATSPFAPIAATLAGIGYIWTVVQDYHHTKQFTPLPLVRGNFFDFLSSMGDADERSNYSVNHELETMKFLGRDEQIEYAMLQSQFEVIVYNLGQVQAGKRFHAYRWITQAFNRFRAMPQQQQVSKYLESVNPDTRINYQQVKAIAQQQSQYQCIELPQPVQSNWQDNALANPPGGNLASATSVTTPVNFSASLPPQTITQSSAIKTETSGYTPTFELDIIGELTNKISNTLIVGAPRAGKGVILSNALRAFKTKYPGRKIFVIDPKGNVDEAGYFEGVVDRYEPLACERLPATEIVRWVKRCIEDYHNYAEANGGCLLVIDECVTIGSAFIELQDNYLKTQMSRIASLGDVQKKNVWVLTQSPFVGEFGIGKGMIAQMTVVALIREPGILELWSGSGVKIPKTTIEELSNLISKSPRERAIYLQRTGRWYSMPELPIYAYYDRDLDKKISQASTPSDALSNTERQSLRQAQATKIRSSQDMIELLEATIETTIEGFIINVLRQEQRMSELKPAIIKAISQCDRADLLEKFGIEN